MGMWIGGDRDGNPFVTADTLKQSAMTQCEVIMNYYDEKIYQLYREFSSRLVSSMLASKSEKWLVNPRITRSTEKRALPPCLV